MHWVRMSWQNMQILLFSIGLEGLKKHSSGVEVPGTMKKAGKGTREVRE